jgi:2-phospho-L-lactate transferase/gluconeogenesis factor (CofD/UPF0052 family)
VQDISDDKIVLMLSSSHESLLMDVSVKKLTDQVKSLMGENITLTVIVSEEKVQSPAQKLEQQAQQQITQAQTNIDMNGFVQAIKRDLQAELVPGSIHSQSEQSNKEENQ